VVRILIRRLVAKTDCPAGCQPQAHIAAFFNRQLDNGVELRRHAVRYEARPPEREPCRTGLLRTNVSHTLIPITALDFTALEEECRCAFFAAISNS